MRWVADELGQGRKAAALRRLAQAPWGRLAGAAEIATRRMPPVDGRCTVTFSSFSIFDLRFSIERPQQYGGSDMTEDELKQRTKRFALRVIRLVRALPKTSEGRAIGNQLMRAGTSVGANYRAACRARSRADFASKLAIVEEEADESAYWMELVVEADLMKKELVGPLLSEANELVAIMSASRQSVRSKIKNQKSKIETVIETVSG